MRSSCSGWGRGRRRSRRGQAELRGQEVAEPDPFSRREFSVRRRRRFDLDAEVPGPGRSVGEQAAVVRGREPQVGGVAGNRVRCGLARSVGQVDTSPAEMPRIDDGALAAAHTDVRLVGVRCGRRRACLDEQLPVRAARGEAPRAQQVSEQTEERIQQDTGTQEPGYRRDVLVGPAAQVQRRQQDEQRTEGDRCVEGQALQGCRPRAIAREPRRTDALRAGPCADLEMAMRSDDLERCVHPDPHRPSAALWRVRSSSRIWRASASVSAVRTATGAWPRTRAALVTSTAVASDSRALL